MIYKFRVILDAEDDVIRDIAIESSATMEDFHNAITQAFGFDGTEMASFYVSDDEWTQGEEISLFDMSDGSSEVRLMNETSLDDAASEDQNKLIYVYDFFSMWTFFVELAEVSEDDNEVAYPSLLFSHGELPESAPVKDFEAEEMSSDFGSLEGNDDDDDFNNYDDYDFDENWN
ncbi:IS1096 element passenger TnpR family protein [Neptunitalea lumnitzerae]|uniref:Plasmid pRiA4b Orf3-like domain-containing protein n=1 Tax=Neptunitalea lumnitzerae TaxID=2965509 RepID=A0ABQ5MKM7_9FLAO|nr:hypothetical protein [Neptunitalea sp. Y10]GLB49966.1 hypothetical protein Y10_23340 [Neptunitalea sp. Y10]